MENLRSVLIVDGCRLPFQKSLTGYKNLGAYDLARLVLGRLLSRTGFDPSAVEMVVLGTVVSSVANSNVARDAALAAGVSHTAPAYTVTQACVSANQAITSVTSAIQRGEVSVAIAGGTESLTDIPIRLRRPLRLRITEAQKYRGFLDYLRFIRGLKVRHFLPEIPSIAEYSTSRTMGEDADRLAARLEVSRQDQDEFALRSHRRAARARGEGLLDPEIEPVAIPPSFDVIQEDNGIREETSMEKLASLKPAFVKPWGTVTAGNSSFLTDGAAAVLLMSEDAASKANLEPLASVRGWAWTAQDPKEDLLMGPAYAVAKILREFSLELADFDVFEFHEAFAGQLLANVKALASDEFARRFLDREEAVGRVPMDRLNTLGGSLSLGHPFAATGARLVTTAANRLHRENGRLALVASCAAGGIGNAILLERV